MARMNYFKADFWKWKEVFFLNGNICD